MPTSYTRAKERSDEARHLDETAIRVGCKLRMGLHLIPRIALVPAGSTIAISIATWKCCASGLRIFSRGPPPRDLRKGNAIGSCLLGSVASA
jgi:hypothetical protein